MNEETIKQTLLNQYKEAIKNENSYMIGKIIALDCGYQIYYTPEETEPLIRKLTNDEWTILREERRIEIENNCKMVNKENIIERMYEKYGCKN